VGPTSGVSRARDIGYLAAIESKADMTQMLDFSSAGGYRLAYPDIPLPMTAEEHQPSCFALEEEKGEGWKGRGAMGPAINEVQPSL
jgi:hypothetical protein